MTNTLRFTFFAAALGMASLASAQTHSSHGATAPQGGSAQQHGMMQQHGQTMQRGQVMGNVPADRGSQQLHQSMMAGMQDMQRRPMTGDVDKDFVRMMRQHHLQAIEMSRIQLQAGDDPEAKRMAQKMMAEQQKDIAELDSWLQRHQ